MNSKNWYQRGCFTSVNTFQFNKNTKLEDAVIYEDSKSTITEFDPIEITFQGTQKQFIDKLNK